MTMTIEMDEATTRADASWHEPETMPMLADFECERCGLIPTVEVAWCDVCGIGRMVRP